MSSAAINFTSVNILIARRLMSSKFPIGVATTYNVDKWPPLGYKHNYSLHIGSLYLCYYKADQVDNDVMSTSIKDFVCDAKAWPVCLKDDIAFL